VLGTDGRKIEIVNYAVANALKEDEIRGQDLGLVLGYLEAVEAEPIYYQYALLRVHQNLHSCKLAEIASAVENCNALGEEHKIAKFLRKVEHHIEVTNQKFLLGDQDDNVAALCALYSFFAYSHSGGPPFW